jgi:rhomboid-like protein
LQWLRKNYPIGEDEAIVKRIEREENEEEEKLVRRAVELGFYKPQSGRFRAELGKEGDIYGKSVLQEVRKANEEIGKRKEEKEYQEWMEGEATNRADLVKQLKQNTELRKFESSVVVEGKLHIYGPSILPAFRA